MKRQLTEYLYNNDLYPMTQFAYRPRHSTEDALVLAVNRWLLAKSERKYTGLVMIDMSKAFDRVHHERLVNELYTLGIGGAALHWFCDYLSGRSQQVRVLDSLSCSVGCTRGVSQESVLGPILFVLYTRNLHTALPATVNHQEFADDIILDFSHPNLDLVGRTLTRAVTDISRWLEDIGLVMNASKTQVMFVQPRGAAIATPDVFCNNEQLEVTATAKYLGVIVDDQLSWRPHVAYVSRRTAQTIGQLWRHGRSLTLRARRSWYTSMVNSQLCYASAAFYPSLTAQLLDRLVKISKAGVRAVFQLPRQTPTAPLISRLNISPLIHHFKLKIVVFVHRCLASNASMLFSPFFLLIAEPGLEQSTRRVTRGQVSRLLQIPFVRGPASRASMQFVGSVYWNRLPANIRCHEDILGFKALLCPDVLDTLSLS